MHRSSERRYGDLLPAEPHVVLQPNVHLVAHDLPMFDQRLSKGFSIDFRLYLEEDAREVGQHC